MKSANEDGSLIIFIAFLFFITLIISCGVVDVSDSYLLKKELISAGEQLLSHGIENIDLARYYQSGIDPYSGRVPLDCAKAMSIVYSEAQGVEVRGSSISIDSLSCENDALALSLSFATKPLIEIPYINSFRGSEKISAHLSEASVVPPSL
jgi:hypothetical protein